MPAGWFIPWRRPGRIRMNQCCHCMLYSLAHTLCTTRRGWMRYNLLPCRRTNSSMGKSCSQYPYNPPQQRRIQTGMKWTGRRQLRTPVQLPELTQLFFSSSPPVSQKVNRTAQTAWTHCLGRGSHSTTSNTGRNNRPTCTSCR